MLRATVAVATVASVATGCAFQGLNSLPLPGATGRGPGAAIYHVTLANVATLESNSPVMLNDVVVGSIGTMRLKGSQADVEISVEPGVSVPNNVVAAVAQTSVLGSMHLQLVLPPDQSAQGRLVPGATIPLSKTSTYPSTEQTLSTLAAVVNGGGLGLIGDIIHTFNTAFVGHEGEVRDIIARLNRLMEVLDRQRGKVIATIAALDRLTQSFASQRDTVDTALREISPALDVLIRERPRITTALEKLHTFSDTAHSVIDDVHTDLVRNLTNLEPTLRSLADVGPDLDMALAYGTTFPLSQNFIDRAVRGDYVNMYTIFDLTIPRLKRSLFLGTRWGQEGAELVPAPGDPWYLTHTNNPLEFGLTPPPEDAAPPPTSAGGG
jgi:virulence factor Mce-like protein